MQLIVAGNISDVFELEYIPFQSCTSQQLCCSMDHRERGYGGAIECLMRTSRNGTTQEDTIVIFNSPDSAIEQLSHTALLFPGWLRSDSRPLISD